MLGNITACWEILLHGGQYYCMPGNITAYWAILLHTGQYYCMPGNITAYWEILLHTGQYYCMPGNITAYWEILLHTGQYYWNVGQYYCMLGNFIVSVWQLSIFRSSIFKWLSFDTTLKYNNVYLFRITLLLICVIDIFDFAIVEIVSLEWSH